MIRKVDGSITLSLVVVIGAMLLFAGITLVFVGIDLARTTTSFDNHILVNTYVSSCFDESMYLVNKDKTYTGNSSISFVDGSCSSGVTDETVNIKVLNITGQKGDYYGGKIYRVDTTSKPYTILTIE